MDEPLAQGDRDMTREEGMSVHGSNVRVGDGVRGEGATPTPPPIERTARIRTVDAGVGSYAAAIAWLGWICGIVTSWIVWGALAAAGWWLLCWPALLILVLLYLYSPLAPEGRGGFESDPPEAPSPLGSLMLQRQPSSLEHEPAQVPNGGLMCGHHVG
jgi:hypothetical protein